MIFKQFDSDHLSIRQAASVLEIDSSLVSRHFKTGRIVAYKDDSGNKFTKEADLIDYLSSKLPSGFVARLEDNLTHR